MKRLWAWVLAAGILALAGCAGQQEFSTGQRLYQLRQYDEAIAALEKAAAANPKNGEYRRVLADAKKDAARYEYQRGLSFYEKKQLDQALLAFQKSKEYDPELAQAAQAYDFVKKQRDVIQAVVSEIPGLIKAGRPDEALDKIAEVEQYASAFPEVGDMKTQALADSTILHTKQGNVYLADARFDQAQKEFYVALNRTPNYRPAAEGLAKAAAELKAAALVAQALRLLDKNEYQKAYDTAQEALRVVPGHRGALQALIEVSNKWARALYDEGKTLEAKGGFDSYAEALRKYERAGALTERFADLDERIAALRKVLAGEFLRRAQQYQQLGDDYLGLALVNYKMSFDCDPTQTEVARRATAVKEAFDKRRAFYIDIRSADQTSGGASFSKQLAQMLKETAISSGIGDLYVMAPSEESAVKSSAPSAGGLSGRRVTIFTSLLSENVLTTGRTRPQLMRSKYKVGTRWVPNPSYEEQRQTLADVDAKEIATEQDFRQAENEFDTATTPAEKELAQANLDFFRQRLFDAQDALAQARKQYAATPEQVQEEVYEPYDYKVFTVTMAAKVEVSLEVADTETSTVKSTEIIEGTAKAEDKYNDGVKPTDSEGVTPDVESLPSDQELLADARKSAADKAIARLRKLLSELAGTYYERGKAFEAVGNSESASEYYYAFYLSTPDKTSPEALAAIEYVRAHTHLITPDETRKLLPEAPSPAAGTQAPK